MITGIERARSALHAINAGLPRDEWHEVGRAALAAGLSIDDIDAWSAGAPNYKGRRDVESAFRTVKPDGKTGAGTLFFRAQQCGWQDSARQNGAQRTNTSRPTSDHASAQKIAQRPDTAVLALWNRFEPATEAHPYIVAKHGMPDGLRVVPADDAMTIAGQSVAGWLAVPVSSLAGELCTLQLIPPPGTGKKLNMPGASFDDGMYVVGDAAESARIFVAEGIGQAWACWRATGHAAAVAFGAGRMGTVAELLRAGYPDRRIVVVPDRGKENQAAEIARAVNGEWIELPADKPLNFDVNDYALEFGADAPAELLDEPRRPAQRFNLLTDGDLAVLPPLRWRIRGVLPESGLAAWFGASGSGKSFLVLDALRCVAAGADWFGHRVHACRVVYVALEGEAGIAGRVNAYRIRHGKAAKNLRYLLQPFSLLERGDINELAQAIQAAGGAGIVVLDTLNRAAPGADENDSKSMGAILAAAKELQRLVGGLVLLIHHSGKDSSRGMRGHSSLHAALDAAVEVRRDGDRREWLVAKSKDGADDVLHPFKLEVVELGNDEDGEPVTSCVVRPLEDAPAAVRRALPPKGGNQKAVWDALGEQFRLAQVAPDAPKEVPAGRPVLRLDDAIDATRSRLVCDPKRQTERARTAIQGLIDRGLLVHREGWIWCA